MCVCSGEFCGTLYESFQKDVYKQLKTVIASLKVAIQNNNNNNITKVRTNS